jgi:hypothetical protein
VFSTFITTNVTAIDNDNDNVAGNCSIDKNRIGSNVRMSFCS